MKNFYHPVGDEVLVFEHAFKNNLPLLLKGPTGCGKTRFVEHMAEKFDRPIITVSCNDETSSVDLIGRFLLKGSETVWQDGPLIRAVRTGAILYLDEVAEAREDVIVVIHPLTDFRREIYIDRLNETLKASKEFMLVMSFNPGYQKGFKELKPSTRQRFVTLSFSYPTAPIEEDIVVKETKLDSKLAAKLVGFANKIRNLNELNLLETVSTRLLIHAGLLIQSGLHPRLACDIGIVQTLTDDLQTSQALKDLVALHF